MTLALAIGSAAALSIVIMFVGVLRFVDAQTNADQRIDAQVARQQSQTVRKAEKRTSFVVNRMNRAIADRDFTDEIARELLQADLRITPSEYILIRAGFVLLAFLAAILLTGLPAAGVLFAVVSFFLPSYYLRHRRQKRMQAFAKQLEDVLMLLVGSLRAGYSFLHALNVVVSEIPPPASHEFKRVVREVGLGLSLQEALENLVQRVESSDLDMMVTAISIQQEVGGDLGVILDTISETIRERVRIEGEIRVLTSRQTQTGYVLAGLPVLLGIAIYFINPDYILPLFERGPMLIIPGAAVFLEVVGFIVIRKIVDIKV